jgi:hypothetical protein
MDDEAAIRRLNAKGTIASRSAVYYRPVVYV